MKRKKFLKNLIAIGAAVVLSMSIVACSGGQTTAEEETTTTKKVVVKKETATAVKETTTEEGTIVYKYKGKKAIFGNEIPNIVEKLDGVTIKNGETVFINEYVSQTGSEIEDWYRGSFTYSLYRAMGMDTAELEGKYDGGNDTVIIDEAENYSFINNTGRDFTFKYVEDAGGYRVYFDVY